MRYVINCRKLETGINFYCFVTSDLQQALEKFNEEKNKSKQDKSPILVTLSLEMMSYLN